jgi:peptidoglycan hydrolase-like protein with peptidoglycan-binding domain
MKVVNILIGAVVVVVAVIVIAIATKHRSDLVSDKNACVNNSLSASASGQCVSDLQTMLNWSLYGIDGPNYEKVTGQFTTGTTAEVKQFQSSNSLPDSGTADQSTWQKLCGDGSDAPASWTTAAKNAGCVI